MASIAVELLDIALQMTFLFCVCAAVITDFKTLLIPNWVSVALLAAFAPFAALHLALDAVGGHLLVMAVVLVLSIGFFIAGWMGGGDVKFLSAVSLWMGPGHVAPFAVVMAVLGAALAIGLIGLGKYGFLVDRRLQKVWIIGRVVELAESGQCPYGVAIGSAALIVAPGVFGLG